MIRPAALVIGFGLTLLAGKAANLLIDRREPTAGIDISWGTSGEPYGSREASPGQEQGHEELNEAANIVAGSGPKPTASSGVLQLLPDRATTRAGGFSSLSSSLASATVDAGCFNTEYEHDSRPTGTHDDLRGRDGGLAVLPERSAGRDARGCETGDGRERPVLGAAGAEGGHAEPGCRGHDQRQRLIDAIIQVESAGRADAVGDGGRAVGVLQVWPITVADANRILGREEFSLADRLDPDRSREIFYTITNHYSRGASDEVIARRWNSGPTGDRKACSLDYWRRVQAAMNERTER